MLSLRQRIQLDRLAKCRDRVPVVVLRCPGKGLGLIDQCLLVLVALDLGQQFAHTLNCIVVLLFRNVFLDTRETAVGEFRERPGCFAGILAIGLGLRGR